MGTCKHTPGPWLVRPHWHDTEKFEVYPDRKIDFGEPAEVAEVTGHYCDDDALALEAAANAQLISAAPDFYRAALLRREYEAMPADRGGKNGPKGKAHAAWIAAEDAAIAKAEV